MLEMESVSTSLIKKMPGMEQFEGWAQDITNKGKGRGRHLVCLTKDNGLIFGDQLVAAAEMNGQTEILAVRFDIAEIATGCCVEKQRNPKLANTAIMAVVAVTLQEEQAQCEQRRLANLKQHAGKDRGGKLPPRENAEIASRTCLA